MEQFIVSARKYRPQTFEDVVGQQAITNTLSNAIANNHLAQALLFCGPRGVGKTTCARILAKKINQQASNNFNEDEDFAFNIFELDAASNNSVDDIRELTDQVRIPPQVGKYKVYIVDEVHMLSSAAFNAFLKTLEEPPKHVIFILATTEKHKIIPTILSRCQIFDFKRITVSDAKNYLATIAEREGVNAEDDALHIIAQKADGAMRDALSIYDRVVSFCGNHLTREAVTENLNVLDYDVFFESTDLILNNDIPGVLLQFNEVLAKGFDGQHYIAGLAAHFRDLLVAIHQETIPLLEVGEGIKAKYLAQSQRVNKAFLLRAIELANTCDFNYRTSQNQRLHVELCIMQLASLTHGQPRKKEEPKIMPAKAVNPSTRPDQPKPEVKPIPSSSAKSDSTSSSSTTETSNNSSKPEAKPTTDLPQTGDTSIAASSTTNNATETSQKSATAAPKENFEADLTEDTDRPVAEPTPTLTQPTAEKPKKAIEPIANASIEPAKANESTKAFSTPQTSVEVSAQQQNILQQSEIAVLENKAPTTSKQVVITEKTEEDSTAAKQNTNKISNPESPKRVSGLSLKSIEVKRQHKAEQAKKAKKAEYEADDTFTPEQVLKAWEEYTKKERKKGHKILASVLGSDKPKVDGNEIKIVLPNETMKIEIERAQGDLMRYIKKKLNNTHISLAIEVNKEVAKKYAFTPREKYDKLNEKNPLVDQLRIIFDLSI